MREGHAARPVAKHATAASALRSWQTRVGCRVRRNSSASRSDTVGRGTTVTSRQGSGLATHGPANIAGVLVSPMGAGVWAERWTGGKIVVPASRSERVPRKIWVRSGWSRRQSGAALVGVGRLIDGLRLEARRLDAIDPRTADARGHRQATVPTTGIGRLSNPSFRPGAVWSGGAPKRDGRSRGPHCVEKIGETGGGGAGVSARCPLATDAVSKTVRMSEMYCPLEDYESHGVGSCGALLPSPFAVNQIQCED